MLMDLKGPSYAPLSCGKAVYLVVLLHGRGADGDDLIRSGPQLAANPAQGGSSLAAHAPFPCDQAPQEGADGSASEDPAPEKTLAGFGRRAEMLDSFSTTCWPNGGSTTVTWRLSLFAKGRSWPCMSACPAQKPIGAVVAFSGVLHSADVLEAEIRSRPPVLLIHGDADPVTPVASLGEGPGHA